MWTFTGPRCSGESWRVADWIPWFANQVIFPPTPSVKAGVPTDASTLWAATGIGGCWKCELTLICAWKATAAALVPSGLIAVAVGVAVCAWPCTPSAAVAAAAFSSSAPFSRLPIMAWVAELPGPERAFTVESASAESVAVGAVCAVGAVGCGCAPAIAAASDWGRKAKEAEPSGASPWMLLGLPSVPCSADVVGMVSAGFASACDCANAWRKVGPVLWLLSSAVPLALPRARWVWLPRCVLLVLSRELSPPRGFPAACVFSSEDLDAPVDLLEDPDGVEERVARSVSLELLELPEL